VNKSVEKTWSAGSVEKQEHGLSLIRKKSKSG